MSERLTTEALRLSGLTLPPVTPGGRDEFVAMLADEREQQCSRRLRVMTPEERRAWSERQWQDARRESERRREQRACPVCGTHLLAAGRKVGYYGHDHNSATYCSNACKQKAYRGRQRVTADPSLITRNDDNGGDDRTSLTTALSPHSPPPWPPDIRAQVVGAGVVEGVRARDAGEPRHTTSGGSP